MLVGEHSAEYPLGRKKKVSQSQKKTKGFTWPKKQEVYLAEKSFHLAKKLAICCMARSLRSLHQVAKVATLRHGHMARRSPSLRSCI